MAKGLNKATIIGRLGQDPDVRYMPSGDPVANISVATDESYKDKNGNKVDKTEWHRVVVFGKLADIVQQYIKKGDQIYAEGRLQTRKWADQSGQDRYTTEIVVDIRGQILMLGSPGGQSNNGGQGAHQDPQGVGTSSQQKQQPQQQTQQNPVQNAQPSAPIDDFDDDIPF